MVKENREFVERKELIELQHKYDLEKHELETKKLAFRRENDRIHHENEMTRQRIKFAEMRKLQIMKEQGRGRY